MVCSQICPSAQPHLICWIYYIRDRYRFVLPVHARVVRSRQSHERRHQVGIRGSHRRHVLVCDDVRRDVLQYAIHFFHR